MGTPCAHPALSAPASAPASQRTPGLRVPCTRAARDTCRPPSHTRTEEQPAAWSETRAVARTLARCTRPEYIYTYSSTTVQMEEELRSRTAAFSRVPRGHARNVSFAPRVGGRSVDLRVRSEGKAGQSSARADSSPPVGGSRAAAGHPEIPHRRSKPHARAVTRITVHACARPRAFKAHGSSEVRPERGTPSPLPPLSFGVGPTSRRRR